MKQGDRLPLQLLACRSSTH